MQPISLTARLQAVCDMVPTGYVVADIGTDHGYVPVALVESGKVPFAIAADVNESPLEAAIQLVESRGLEAIVDCRLGSGLEVLASEEADVVTICGMGGFLMRDLLAAAPYKPDTLILQPQNGHAELRKYLASNGYHTIAERYVEDMGHLYIIWHLQRGEGPCPYYGALSADDILWQLGAAAFGLGDALFIQKLDHLIRIESQALQSMEVVAGSEVYRKKERYLQALEACRYDYCTRHHSTL